MENIIIVGSGFSAFITYLKFKKYNPCIITSTNKHFHNLKLNDRRNLKSNKLFAPKSKSKGNLVFKLNKNTKLHDRLSLGGNSNIWGGFININSINPEIIQHFMNLGISLNKLDQSLNGYISNNEHIRQTDKVTNKVLFIESFINFL